MQGSPEPEALRTRVYIDGYNFYYGCLRRTPYKWLDLLSLFERHILTSALVKDAAGHNRKSALLTSPSIKFFTAKIIESVARSVDSVSSQARYHTALSKLHDGRIELIEGYYAVNKMTVKIVDAENPNRPHRECQEILAWKVEEKQSDVSLALQAYHDAITGKIDHAVIVTNDTDIAPALEMIKAHTGVIIGLVIPTRDHTRQPNTDLVKHAHWCRTHITDEELAASQLPRVLPGRKPTVKPESWYAFPELLQQILDLAIPVRGSKAKVFQWMNKQSPFLDDAAPIDLIETEEGAHKVLTYIRSWIAEHSIDDTPS